MESGGFDERAVLVKQKGSYSHKKMSVTKQILGVDVHRQFTIVTKDHVAPFPAAVLSVKPGPIIETDVCNPVFKSDVTPFQNTLSGSKPCLFMMSQRCVSCFLKRSVQKKKRSYCHPATFLAMRQTGGHGCN